jgi:hypothetical protein
MPTAEEIADLERREQAAKDAAARDAASAAPSSETSSPTITGLSARVRAVAAALAVTATQADRATRAVERTRQTSKEKITEARVSREQQTMRDLESGYTASLIASWWEIVVIDANSPGLNSLETEMRRFTKHDLSFMKNIRRELSRVQQLNAWKNRRTNGFRGGLTREQAEAAMQEYRGGNF